MSIFFFVPSIHCCLDPSLMKTIIAASTTPFPLSTLPLLVVAVPPTLNLVADDLSSLEVEI